jgi:acetolactate synthase-1/2/3 large subunit
MNAPTNQRSGGQILVDQLRIHGVDTAFCVPGESYLATLDALFDARDEIRLVVCRQEGGAAYMAEAYGKLTGQPGIVFATRGPGATNASLGIHTAHQDSTPVILFLGQVATYMLEREAFQEIDFRHMYKPMAKWVAQIDDPARIPEMVQRAFHVATSGRPGPVVLALPEDMQRVRVEAADGVRYTAIQPAPAAEDMDALRGHLERAQRPVVIVGGSGWDAASVADFRKFVEANNLPCAASFRRQDLFDNRLPNYIGDAGLGINPALAKQINDADVLLVVGAQMSETLTDGYKRFGLPVPKQTLIHVAAGLDELSRVYEPALAINAGMKRFAAAAAAMKPVDGAKWAQQVKDGHAAYLDNTAPPANVSNFDQAKMIRWLSDNLPEDAIVSNGAGNFSQWVHRFFTHKGFPTQLAPQSGSMGYGVPSGVAAGLVHPDRVVVSVNGDGDFLMCGQEIATARQYGLKVVFIVVNNGTYGTIRMHQERDFPGRISGTDLINPDFAALAKAYGLHGEVVDSNDAFTAAFDRAVKSGGAALIEVRVDPDQISPRATISGFRKAAGMAG